MTEKHKLPLVQSKLFKQHKTQLYSINSHYFSQIKNLRSSSTSTKISGKSCKTANSQIKSNHYSGSLFEEAHKINPAVQSYLPKHIQPTSNQVKMKALLIHKQKSQRLFKSNRVFKTLSLNQGSSGLQQKSVQNEANNQLARSKADPMSSMTFLIMNQCQYVGEKLNQKGKIYITNQIISTEQNYKHLKSEHPNQRLPTCENPYELLPLRQAKRYKYNHGH